MTNPPHFTLLDLPMPVETPRLILRPLAPGDGAEIHQAKQDSWNALARWMPWATDIGNVEKDELYARQKHAAFILREDLTMTGIDRETGRLALFTGLHRFDLKIRKFEIGYWARAGFQGRGLMTEAVNALTRYAFNELAARRVQIIHAAGNDASRRVIERLGYTLEGKLKNDALLPDGTVTDHWVYGRTDAHGLPDLDVRWGPT